MEINEIHLRNNALINIIPFCPYSFIIQLVICELEAVLESAPFDFFEKMAA